MTLLLLLACADDDVIPLHFDGPIAGAVLPAYQGPWNIPTGFVASQRDGTITPLDLKMGRLLTDDPTASFLRSAALTTGRERLLTDVAVTGIGDGKVAVWALDGGLGQVLKVPYILSVDDDGFPVEVEPTATDPVFVDADGSGSDTAAITDVVVRAGFTTTEDWYIEYDGERWWAKGSRSGTQVHEPIPGETFWSDDRELQFELTGTATKGDRFEIRTDTGVAEYTPAGIPTAILALDGRIYVSVASTPGRIVVFDAPTGTVVGTIELPTGSQPGRMAVGGAGELYVADSALAKVWVVRLDEDKRPSTVPVESIDVAGPVMDVAWQGGLDRNDVEFENLFVAPVGMQRVDVYDLLTGEQHDPNPYTVGVEGIDLGAPVSGLAASTGDVWLPHRTAWDAQPRVPTVVVTVTTGVAYQLEASTGCAVMDEGGPYPAPEDDTAYYVELDDQGLDSDSQLRVDDGTGYQVVPSDCGGVTLAETWDVTYDGATLSWEVVGSRSGVQTARAVEGQRYISDTGAISFVIESGPAPATDGDAFHFIMDDGLRTWVGGDTDEDGATDDYSALEFPGRPVTFSTLNGPSGGGWDPVDERQYALVPAAAADIAIRLYLDSGKSEVVWK